MTEFGVNELIVIIVDFFIVICTCIIPFFHPDHLSDPSCTDIMEIYNAVEEMDDDDEVNLD